MLREKRSGDRGDGADPIAHDLGRPRDFAVLRLVLDAVRGPVDLHPALARVLHGEPRAEDAELAEAIHWIEREVLSRPPERRPAASLIAARCERVRALLDGVSATPATVVYTEAGALTLPDGAVLRPTGAARRIVDALVAAHQRGPHALLSVWDLVEVGWPGERMRATSATNRAYVTITRLRAAGLGPWIERLEGGYRLTPGLTVTRG